MASSMHPLLSQVIHAHTTLKNIFPCKKQSVLQPQHYYSSSVMAIKCQMGVKFLLISGISFLHCCCILQSVRAAADANVTDPQEVAVLKTVAKKLGNAIWDFNVDPCSGQGSWNRSMKKGKENFVDCNCTLDGGKFCHVTRIFLKRQNLAGVVPPEFANLTHLTMIDLTRNYLKGSIPPELGSLTHLKNLSLGINRLSGSIPVELGNLSSLESLVVVSNNLSGHLPKQLAKLSKLDRLHVGSNNFTGHIPKRFSDFKMLRDFRADSNNFVGEIPDFIGNWKNISILRLEATNLWGPIPSNFSGLTSLTDLRISHLTRGGSNLSFIHNLRHLRILVLRNALIYGKLPTSIADFKKLKTLDLGFNNLTGSIPDQFHTLTTNDIEYLYLGNNSLAGKLQPWLRKISNVDLSYNNFSGDFPSGLTGSRELNLIGNLFNTDLDSRKEDYLQRSFRCNKGYQKNLAINCGGELLRSNSSVIYESDLNPLGPSTFFLSSDKNQAVQWAVSNTGHFMDNTTQTAYIKTASSNSQFTTGDNTLYRTARSSPNSLRYYGLCLHNGPYNVQLHFAEIVFSNKKSFSSLGRRIFDVYIQGTRMLQNFNIEEAAGGADKVVIKDFKVNVTKNYMEIHFFWTGKGTYNIPDEGTYGPLVSAIRVTSEFKRNRTPMIIGIVFGIVIFLGLVVLLSFIIIKKRKQMQSRSMEPVGSTELTNLKNINSFSLEEIRSATSDFHSENKIGEGGFGAVFKGIFPDGKTVAVKQMFTKSRQGNREFLNEVGTISAVQHPNLVKLYGCCIEGKQLLLVYEYLENNSLARALFGPEEFRLNLNWLARYNILLGVARGLAYLHGESRLRIIHRDIKSTNILLDQDLNSKISDFGLAKLFDQDKTHVSTRVAGTIGYMAPEYALKGQLTEKADVYSFGVVVLEVVSGRAQTEKLLQGEMIYLLEWTWHLYKENKLMDLVDVNLKSSTFSVDEILRTIRIGLLCTHSSPKLRPSMSMVVEMLEGKIEAHISNCQPPNLSYKQHQVLTLERQASCSTSLGLEGPGKGSISSQASHISKQRNAEDDDNDENSLIFHQMSSDIYPVSVPDHP